MNLVESLSSGGRAEEDQEGWIIQGREWVKRELHREGTLGLSQIFN